MSNNQNSVNQKPPPKHSSTCNPQPASNLHHKIIPRTMECESSFDTPHNNPLIPPLSKNLHQRKFKEAIHPGVRPSIREKFLPRACGVARQSALIGCWTLRKWSWSDILGRIGVAERAKKRGALEAWLITRVLFDYRVLFARTLLALMFIFERERWEPKMAVHLPFIQREKPVRSCR